MAYLAIPSISLTEVPSVNNLSTTAASRILPGAKPPPLRTTRFVCISDTHNRNPLTGDFKVPKGDVLLHAGDLTNAGTLGELKKTVKWLEKLDFEVKVVIAGNHDLCLDPAHPDYPAALALFTAAEPHGLHYLPAPYSCERITLLQPPQTSFTIFGCPLTPTTEPGRPLTYPANSPPWSAIPVGTDIVLTHTPAKYHLDSPSIRTNFLGCEHLRRALWHIRPSLHVCGHIHESRGAELVRWDITPEYRVIWRELSSITWVDPASLPNSQNKTSKIDLTPQGPWEGLDRHRETCFINSSIMKRSYSSALRGHGRERYNGILVLLELSLVNEGVVSTLTADESERLEVVRRVRRRSTVRERMEGMKLSVAFAGLRGRLRGGSFSGPASGKKKGKGKERERERREISVD